MAKKCWVAGPVAFGRYTLTASFCIGRTVSRSGSLSAWAPGGMVIVRWPPNRSCRIVPGCTRAPERWTATVARPTSSGRAPKAFVSRTRTRSPPTLPVTMLRTVWLRRPCGLGQLAPGNVPAAVGLPCQLATHRRCVAAAARTRAAAPAAAVADEGAVRLLTAVLTVPLTAVRAAAVGAAGPLASCPPAASATAAPTAPTTCTYLDPALLRNVISRRLLDVTAVGRRPGLGRRTMSGCGAYGAVLRTLGTPRGRGQWGMIKGTFA